MQMIWGLLFILSTLAWVRFEMHSNKNLFFIFISDIFPLSELASPHPTKKNNKLLITKLFNEIWVKNCNMLKLVPNKDMNCLHFMGHWPPEHRPHWTCTCDSWTISHFYTPVFPLCNFEYSVLSLHKINLILLQWTMFSKHTGLTF